MKRIFEEIENVMTRLTEILTRIRPASFVKKLQLILILITLSMVTYFLAVPFLGQAKLDLSKDGVFALGQISHDTIASTKEIIYDDEEKTKAEKSRAYQSAAFFFDRDSSTLTNDINRYIEEDFENLKSLSGQGHSAKIYSMLIDKNPRWRNRNKEDLDVLISYPRKDRIREMVEQAVSLIFLSHCVCKDIPFDRNLLRGSGAKVRSKGGKENISVLEGSFVIERTEMYGNRIVSERLNKILEEKFSNSNFSLLPIVKKLSYSYIYSFPACVFNSQETENERKSAMDKVASIKSKINANEIIIKSGDLVTPEIRYRLEMLNKYATRANVTSIISILLIQLVFLGIIVVYLKKYDPKRLNDVSSNVIVFSLIWIFVIFSFISSKFFYLPETNYDSIYYFGLFVPVGMICLILAFIYDEQLSIAIGFYLSFFVFFASRNNSTSFLIAFSATIVSAYYAGKVRKRIDFIKAGFLITFIQMIISTSGYLFDSRVYWVTEPSGSFFRDLTRSNVFKLYTTCFINGFVCSTMTQFLLPIYEYIFNIPTRFKLQELADTGHPLLQEMLTKAPSTYTHTFLVSALSERAAQNLGLDWLLTRVGVYFHDIGKIPNAGFFVENQHLIPKKENIDRNNPGLAAKIVIDHVLDGIEMAKKARLPREVINFIPEHHGTSTMAFFYHRALADLSSSQRKKVRKQDFMYPGPKPQRKETAIVMIADSVEAASRSMEEVNSHALDELIQKIINIKLSENQLDESGLTIGDLFVIKSSFKEVLLSSLHQRPKYPSEEETKRLENRS